MTHILQEGPGAQKVGGARINRRKPQKSSEHRTHHHNQNSAGGMPMMWLESTHAYKVSATQVFLGALLFMSAVVSLHILSKILRLIAKGFA